MKGNGFSRFAGVFGVVVLIAALVVALAVNAYRPAQAQTTGQAQPTVEPTMIAPGDTRGLGTITVVGEGMATATPDIARTTIGVEVAGDSVREATDEASDIMQAVLDALEGAGVATNDIQTTGYTIFVERRPAEDQTAGAEDTIIYRVNNSVLVTIRDLEQVGAVLDAAIDAGANNIFGVDFSVEDPGEAMAEARAEAVTDAQERAQELATLNNVGVGRVLMISEVIEPTFGPVFSTAQAAEGLGGGAGPIAPGQQQISARIQITYALVEAGAGADVSPVGTPTTDLTPGTTTTPAAGTTATTEATSAVGTTATTEATPAAGTTATTEATSAAGATTTPVVTITPTPSS